MNKTQRFPKLTRLNRSVPSLVGKPVLWMNAAIIVAVVGSFSFSTRGSAGDSSPPSGAIVLSRCRVAWVDQIVLASDRAGILSFVEPTAGGQVEKRQNVAGLNDAVAQAAFETAKTEAENKIDIEYAKLAAKLAEVEYQRNMAAHKKFPQSVPELELKRLELAAQRARMQITQAEHKLKIAELTRDQRKAELATYRVQTPIAGLIARVLKKRGEAVNQGDPIVELVNTDRVRVEGELEISDAWKVKRGDEVRIQLQIQDVDLPVEKETFIGKVTFVDVTVDSVRRRTRVVAEVENRNDFLRAGLTAQMIILPTPKTSVSKKP